MKLNRKLTWMLMFASVSLLTQCKDSGEVVEPDEENELITTVRLNFTEEGTSDVIAFTYQDVDGDGGNAPTKFDSIQLKANTSYTLNIEVLDESKTPAEDITEEIEEKKEEHLFVFTSDPAALATYTYGDQDSRGFNIGLTGTVETGTAGHGNFKVQLRHQPAVNNMPVKDGTPNPGSDDVNITFHLMVE